MTMTVKCFCSAVVQADDEDTLVAQVSHHASSVHDVELTREDILAMANSSES
jgi:predicted small metal-binding protein